MKTVLYLDSPVGRLGIAEEGGALTDLFFFEKGGAPEGLLAGETPLLRRAGDELAEYFEGRRSRFDLPLAPRGTAFQRAVWEKLCEIPYGRTITYGELAARVGNPKACRAVGMANHRNPISLIIPCHRVIGKDGSLTGYGGGLWIKEYLLALEKAGAQPDA